jgi:hypothetical protein
MKWRTRFSRLTPLGFVAGIFVWILLRNNHPTITDFSDILIGFVTGMCLTAVLSFFPIGD